MAQQVSYRASHEPRWSSLVAEVRLWRREEDQEMMLSGRLRGQGREASGYLRCDRGSDPFLCGGTREILQSSLIRIPDTFLLRHLVSEVKRRAGAIILPRPLE